MWKIMVVIPFKWLLFVWLRNEQNDPMMRKAPSPITMKTNVGDDNKFKVDESCIKRWKATNIVSLAERNLKVSN